MSSDSHSGTEEHLDYLRKHPRRTIKRVNSRTPKAIARRKKYKANKPKKTRIRCQFCRKQFTPKRSTKRFCNAVCRNKSNIQEHKQFKEFGIYTMWYQLPVEVRKASSQIETMRKLVRR